MNPRLERVAVWFDEAYLVTDPHIRQPSIDWDPFRQDTASSRYLERLLNGEQLHWIHEI